MNKQKFSGIIILMSISLLGIILVQVFWMHKSISVKEDQFDQQISEVLSRAAYRIERNQNAFMLSSMFSGFPKATGAINNNSKPNITGGDSIVISFGDYWNKDPKQNSNLKMQREVKDGMEKTTYGFDTVIVSGNSTSRIQSYSSFIKPQKQPINVTEKPANNPAEIKQQLNSVMDQMILEFSMRDIPVYERIGHSVIEPTLKYELGNLNIPLSFEYAVTDVDGNPLPKLSTNGFKTNKKRNTYQTTLFPNDLMGTTNQLAIYFPEKRNFIFGSLIWLFVASVIFTIIILITFYYTLQTIVNQKRVSEIKTDFINNMTHEFKTPIATISLASDAISNAETIKSPDKISRFIQIIKEENKRMNRQVESVLKMALIDKKDFNLSINDIYVHPLIEQAVNNINLQVEQKGGSIKMKLEAGSDLLKIDETHFINIIYNLLDNANKYTIDNTPEIEISTYNNGGFFFIAVSDNGIGMDKETQDRVFEKFYRYSTGNVHTIKGFGLGLSYVKAIVHAFKGNISIQSEKGKGSTFTIKLPQ